jgi:hypothetical protein
MGSNSAFKGLMIGNFCSQLGRVGNCSSLTYAAYALPVMTVAVLCVSGRKTRHHFYTWEPDFLDFQTFDRLSHIRNEGKEQAYLCIFGDWDKTMKIKQSNP